VIETLVNGVEYHA